jgi:DNA-directed RNA polymerase specialized sigma24 family protein
MCTRVTINGRTTADFSQGSWFAKAKKSFLAVSCSEAEEVVQETVLAVAKGIQGFTYDPAQCAFKTWLLTVTRSKIANQFKKRARQRVAGGLAGKVPD